MVLIAGQTLENNISGNSVRKVLLYTFQGCPIHLDCLSHTTFRFIFTEMTGSDNKYIKQDRVDK